MPVSEQPTVLRKLTVILVEQVLVLIQAVSARERRVLGNTATTKSRCETFWWFESMVKTIFCWFAVQYLVQTADTLSFAKQTKSAREY